MSELINNRQTVYVVKSRKHKTANVSYIASNCSVIIEFYDYGN